MANVRLLFAAFSFASASKLSVPATNISNRSNRSWVNSTDGIHAFLTFDSKADPTAIASHADSIDFVWGATKTKISHWRGSTHPKVVLSYYMPFTRDPTPHTTKDHQGLPTGLPWWKEHHPELVLYTCDKKTPAWECFAGEGCQHVSVPLDLTNPSTLDYQMTAGVLPAAAAGYDAIALDNFGLTNEWFACGAFRGPGGAWVQLYDASNPKLDAKYTRDVLDWTRRFTARVHSDTGMLVIPNFSGHDINDVPTLTVANLTDGFLAEGGFAMWNPIPNTSSIHTPPPMTTPWRFESQVRFIRSMQRRGKAYFIINEWGAGPDFGLNPSGQPLNISGPSNAAIRQFVAASFMMVNGGSCGVYLTCIQCYGGHAGGVGNLSVWYPEWSAPVGHPGVSEPVKNESSGVWMRRYTQGLAIVNPDPTKSYSVPLPSHDSGAHWTDVRGNGVGAAAELAPASGLVLLLDRGA